MTQVKRVREKKMNLTVTCVHSTIKVYSTLLLSPCVCEKWQIEASKWAAKKKLADIALIHKSICNILTRNMDGNCWWSRSASETAYHQETSRRKEKPERESYTRVTLCHWRSSHSDYSRLHHSLYSSLHPQQWLAKGLRKSERQWEAKAFSNASRDSSLPS